MKKLLQVVSLVLFTSLLSGISGFDLSYAILNGIIGGLMMIAVLKVW